MRLHQLEGFFHTALAGGYTRAAETMPYPITEPAVYQQVRKLERSLGVPLLVQAKPRRTILTPEGRALFEFVAPFFRGLPLVVEAVKRRETARLTVAVDGVIGCRLVGPAISALRAKRSGVSVRLMDLDSHGVVRAVLNNEADLGLGVLGLAPGLKEEPLLLVRVALCVPDAHPLARRRTPPAPRDLDGIALCVYERSHAGRALLERMFRDAGVSFTVAAEASSVESLQALVAAGVGPAFVPVTEPARGGRARAEPSRGFKVFDVTGIVPGERVRFGIMARPEGRHAVVNELAALLRARPVLT